jgi:hypothetical protein
MRHRSSPQPGAMLNVAAVTRALEGPGHDVTEAIIDDIMRLAQASEHRAAAERAAAEIKGGSTDFRLIVAFLLGVCEDIGPSALPAVLETLASALSRHWEAIRPEARRARHVDSALCLLFRSIKASIDFHESTRDATWRAWAERMDRALPAACAGAVATLERAIAERVPLARCAKELAGLRARTEAHFNRLPEPAAAPPPEPEPASPPRPAPVEAASALNSAPGDAPEPPPEAAPAGDDGCWIEVSPALGRFIRKLEVFATLVDRGDMSRAAIVAEDIKGSVERFDPRVYLPRLLTPHFRLLSAHIGEIAPHWEATASPAWQALEQLYQVDLEAFLEP